MSDSSRKPFSSEYIFEERDVPADCGWSMRDVLRELESGVIPAGFRRFFDRDPERRTPQGDGLVVSPADGLVETRRTKDALELIVHLRLTDVHVQRVPLSGIVLDVEQAGEGYYYPDDEKYLNGVRKITTIDSAYGVYSVHQITTLLTRRIEPFLRAGDAVLTGQRLGRIRLGSTVLLRLPPLAEPCVLPGERVVAGETVLLRAPAAMRVR